MAQRCQDARISVPEQLNHRERRELKETQAVGQTGAITLRVRAVFSQVPHLEFFALLSVQIAQFREDLLYKRARQTESWRDRIMQRERPGGRSSIILSFPVAALPCCALCGWRTPVYGIKHSGKGGCWRFRGFRRSRVSEPGGCWSLPLPNG